MQKPVAIGYVRGALYGLAAVCIWAAFIVVSRLGVRTSLVALNMWTFSYVSGSKWVQSEISDNKDLQSFQMKDGLCLDRKLMRSAGGGLLLYNPGLKQFEIRSRDDFKTIYPSLGCI